MGIVLRDSTFKQLRDFVYEKTGIYIPDSKKYLVESRLTKRVLERNLNTFEEYLYLIQSNTDSNELLKLYDAITTNETSFFREPRQFDVLVKHIVPSIIQKQKTVKIWSAACSTGEEPYTIRMLLIENMFDTVEVIASDISESALESARNGVYGSYSVRNVPEFYLRKYFKNSGQSYELDEVVKKGVRFVNVNLVDEKRMRFMHDMDVIFCRNVLIYFGEGAKQKALSLLYGCLKPGGFLFIGSSESLHNATRAFKPVIIDGVIVYQRE